MKNEYLPILCELCLEFGSTLRGPISVDAKHYLVDVFERTIIKGLEQEGFDHWDLRGGREYGCRAARKLALLAARETGGHRAIEPRDLDAALIALSTKTQSALERREPEIAAQLAAVAGNSLAEAEARIQMFPFCPAG